MFDSVHALCLTLCKQWSLSTESARQVIGSSSCLTNHLNMITIIMLIDANVHISGLGIVVDNSSNTELYSKRSCRLSGKYISLPILLTVILLFQSYDHRDLIYFQHWLGAYNFSEQEFCSILSRNNFLSICSMFCLFRKVFCHFSCSEALLDCYLPLPTPVKK